jgi:putative ABC transport system permease protein
MLRRWWRLLGMVVGVGIALGIGMTLMAVSAATMELLTGDYQRSGADLYAIQEGGTIIPVLPGDNPGTIEHARHVLSQIRAAPGVSAAVGTLSWTLEREHERVRRRDERSEMITAVGVDGDPTAVPGMLLLDQGRWIQRTDEAVLGRKLSRDRGLPIGSSIRLSGRDFTVVGVGRLRGFGFNGDAAAYLDLRALRERADRGDIVNIIAVDTTQPELTRSRIATIDSLAVYDTADLMRLAAESQAADRVSNWLFTGMTLLIAALFVSSLLGRSVSQRRLEFATLRAIGVPTRTILLTVASEAILISVVAGIVGVGISATLGALINGYMAPAFDIETLYVVDAGLYATVFALAIGLGLAAGLFPARRATRVDPVDVLREA